MRGYPVGMSATERLESIMLAQARHEDDGERAERLRRLAETMEDMTPAERTWVESASEEEMREFVQTLRTGCEPEGDG